MLLSRAIVVAIWAVPALGSAAEPFVKIEVDPPTVRLSGPDARYSLIVTGMRADGRHVDLTADAKLVASTDRIVRTDNNTMRAIGDGTDSIRVDVRGQSVTVPVVVTGSGTARRFHFENDIEPLFGRFGCNSSGCHGKAEGQNGFKLSVFGFDPAADYAAIVKEARGRRIFPAAAERSLFLLKASGQVPHGGGIRIAVGSDAFESIRGWIAAGAPVGRADEPTVERIRVEPAERVLDMRAGQQLRVIARYTDGRDVDVTHNARFQTNNEGVATASADGRIQTTDVPGEAAVMASFMNEVAVCRVLVPRAEAVAFPKLPIKNFIDPLVDAKLKKLNIVPSGPVDNASYLRRVYLDVIGTLPTPDEVRKFLADKSADKRAKLVDALLERSEYADVWALKWADVLRVDRQALGAPGAYAYYRWIREAVAENRPFDKFARELIAAEGPLAEVPEAGFYKVVPKPGEAANTLSQVFLGIRIACAECHHHPFDRWSQTDYYGMAAFFSPVGVRKIGMAEVVSSLGESTAKHLRTSETVSATPLGGKAAASVKGDQREGLAAWMTAPENPFFARNLVNRLWAHFLGRGIVEPVDDVRSTNPPTNPELLNALAKKFVESKFDVKAMVRLICASRVYQTSSTPNETNARDDQNYSRMIFKRPDAEVLMDMVTQTTGVPEKFDGVPLGTRAIQLWDSKVRHYFLKQFGRPVRASACECERNAEPNIAQVLHLLNSDFLQEKLRHEDGTVARLCRTFSDDAKILEELWLMCLSRAPTPTELTQVTAHLRKTKIRREGFEDVAWALLNTKEFLFNH
ncbi:MAG TPA: DUF1549 and DUF1553 domain-containing protein [Gemmataceae bacterium]|nr:DUF1549 and DUF1553 domain-containing protein [Gemmataceae bacterium]